MKLRDSLTTTPNILIFRPLHLGDMLCIVPAVRALRAHWPGARIGLIGLPWAESFVRRFSHYFDDFIRFPGFPALDSGDVDPVRIAEFLRRLRAQPADLVLQMNGDGSVANPLVLLFNGTITAGFYREGRYCPDAERFLVYPDNLPEIRRHLALMEFLGIPAGSDDLEFPLRSDDWQDLAAVPQLNELLDMPYICLHPGARFRSRRWPPERFAEVADAMADAGFPIVITGSAGESDTAARVGALMNHPFLDLSGRTSMGALAALLSRAHLVISNDTGISHLAAALKVPSTIVASGSDVERWSPLNRDLHRVLWHDVPCRPCLYEECPIDHDCAKGVATAQVIEQSRALLEGSP